MTRAEADRDRYCEALEYIRTFEVVLEEDGYLDALRMRDIAAEALSSRATHRRAGRRLRWRRRRPPRPVMTWPCEKCGRRNDVIDSPVPVYCVCGNNVPRDPMRRSV